MDINIRQHSKRTEGFTIVELLIVVVVIAILASITIIGYNGVRTRAQESMLSAEASQISKKLATFAVEANETYPSPTQFYNDLGLTDEDLERYRYSVSNNNTTFCLTVQKDGMYFQTSNANMSPTKGRCSQHQPVTITNLATNPSAEVAGKGWNVVGGATGSVGRDTAVSLIGGGSARTLFNSTGAGGTYYGSSAATRPVIYPGQTYTVSFYHRTNLSNPITVTPRIGWWNASGTLTLSTSVGESVITDNTKWRRVFITAIAPPNSQSASIHLASDTSVWANNDRQYIDGLMVTQGPEHYPYADGSFTDRGWSWTGDEHDSTSTGPSW